MEEKQVNQGENIVKRPSFEMSPVTIKETLLGDDGKTYEVERTVMVPKLPNKGRIAGNKSVEGE